MDREHRKLASKILISRSIPGGIPWSPERDRSFISAERSLWADLSDPEKAEEQSWLSSLWSLNWKDRVLFVPDDDVDFATNIRGTLVPIPDSAFGLASNGYRPWARGPYGSGGVPWTWLWVKGYQVVGYDTENDMATIIVPTNRIVQESERLLLVMSKYGCTGATVRGVYDPHQGISTLELHGVDKLRESL